MLKIYQLYEQQKKVDVQDYNKPELIELNISNLKKSIAMFSCMLNLVGRSKILKLNRVPLLIKKQTINSYVIKYLYSSSQSQTIKQTSQQSKQQYTQRAYSPSYMSKLLIQQLSSSSYQKILHQINLYSSKLIPFDYDYFCQSLKRLIPYQQKLSLQELIMIFELSIEYKINHVILQTHFLNQIYCRVYLNIKKQLNQYDQKIQNQLNMTYNMLEKGSADHFNVISQQFKHLLEQDTNTQNNNQNNNQSNNQSDKEKSQKENPLKLNITQLNTKSSVISKPIYHAQQRKNKAKNITPQTLQRIINIFLSVSSKNIQFNKLLLQVNTIRLDKLSQSPNLNQLTPQFLITYTRLTINLLQLYMSQYHSAVQASTNTQPAIYTHRSIKQIYKLQAFYYYQVAKLVQQNKLLSNATNQQLSYFIQLISGFPIKRRSFRKSIGQVLISQTKKRGIDLNDLMKFFQLSKYDNKLLQHLQNTINGEKSLPSSQQKQSIEQTSQQTKKPLVPEIIDQLNQQKQKKFKMPSQLFRKVTKRKSKPKNKKYNKSQQIQIDLTQQDQTITQKQPQPTL